MFIILALCASRKVPIPSTLSNGADVVWLDKVPPLRNPNKISDMNYAVLMTAGTYFDVGVVDGHCESPTIELE